MARAKVAVDNQGKFIGLRIDCPGCGYHVLPVTTCPTGYEPSPHYGDRHHWGWNGFLDFPTFTPSILTKTGHYIDGNDKECWCNIKERLGVDSGGFNCYLCHSFVTDGRIQFLSDSSHALSGQTVDLSEIE